MERAMDDRTNAATLSDEASLRGLYPRPRELAIRKQLDRLDDHCRNFIAHSPLLVLGSTRAGCGTDVSPRGDAPGFARVLDDHTIAIPDRPGNNRLDTMSNIVADAEVGLLFFIPGIDEALRSTAQHGSAAIRSSLPPRRSKGANRGSSFWSRCGRPSSTAVKRSSAPASGWTTTASSANPCRRSGA
jgi:predicted pyridoxine 5'-phosphate oxidase superfamily flavin-nucleotide-binding protein